MGFVDDGAGAAAAPAPGEREHFSAFLYVHVDDVDATYQRAVDAGAEVIETK
jgi:uncharacterized glyoxalase superfamily protein PhnB